MDPRSKCGRQTVTMTDRTTQHIWISHHTLTMSLNYRVKYLRSKNCHAQELIQTNCHVRLGHSKLFLKYLPFNSVRKRHSHQPYKKSHYRLYTTAVTKKALQQNAVRDQQLISHWWRQSVSQNWSTAVWYLLTHINLSINTTTTSNSFSLLYTSQFTNLASNEVTNHNLNACLYYLLIYH